jgi:hypothetical protein
VNGRAAKPLAIACAAAVAASVGDLLMLYMGNAMRPELALEPLPPAMLWPGALLGVIGIPLYALGYVAAARDFRRRAMARLVVYPGVIASLGGAVIHGLTALEIQHGIAAGATARPPLEAVVAAGPWLVGLWVIVGAMFLVASVAFALEQLRTATGGARLLAFANPTLVTVALVSFALPNEWLRSFLAPAAPNLAHVVFFFALWRARVTSRLTG